MARNTIDIFLNAKKNRKKVTMVTCYDYSMARIVDSTDIDSILIGDSMGMTMLGYDSTLPVTVDDILLACKAVVRGTTKPFIVADMPFMSYQASFEEGMHNAARLLAEGGAQAVKIEGATPATVMLIRELIDHGIPVIGHLGLTPQSFNQFGGFKGQAKDMEAIAELLLACEHYADAGVQAAVLECIPAEVAKHITMTFPFATIGIGAGADCDGEVQVLQDMLGMSARAPKHAKRFLEGFDVIGDALREYDRQVKAKEFPTAENTNHVDESVIEQAEDYLDGIYDTFLDRDGFPDN